jgi:hypothetical protein
VEGGKALVVGLVLLGLECLVGRWVLESEEGVGEEKGAEREVGKGEARDGLNLICLQE